RDELVEDFLLDMHDAGTSQFVANYFGSRRSYGEARTPRVVKNIKNEKLRDEDKEAEEQGFNLNDNESKKQKLDAVDNLKKSLKAYAEVLRPLKGILPD